MGKHAFIDKYFVYRDSVHQVKRVNRISVSTYSDMKIDIKFVGTRIIGDTPTDACEAYLAMLRAKLELEREYARRTCYESAFRDVAKVEQRISRIVALKLRLLVT